MTEPQQGKDWMEQLRACGEGRCDHEDRRTCVDAIFSSGPVLLASKTYDTAPEKREYPKTLKLPPELRGKIGPR